MSGQSMYDRTGWEAVTCARSDEVRFVATGVSSYPHGLHSSGVVFTEWHDRNGRPILRDYRYSDDRDCEHLIPEADRG